MGRYDHYLVAKVSAKPYSSNSPNVKRNESPELVKKDADLQERSARQHSEFTGLLQVICKEVKLMTKRKSTVRRGIRGDRSRNKRKSLKETAEILDKHNDGGLI